MQNRADTMLTREFTAEEIAELSGFVDYLRALEDDEDAPLTEGAIAMARRIKAAMQAQRGDR